MGCGQIAILGQYQKKIDPKTEVTSADIYDDFIENAKKNVIENDLDLRFVKTDMFSNINEKFDLITFNPPYVPLNYKKKAIKYEKISFSGKEGTDAINAFLKDGKKYLNQNGLIFLGVNLFYVPKDILIKIVNFHNFKINEIKLNKETPLEKIYNWYVLN